MVRFVYLVWVETTTRFKIGLSDNPKKRLGELQVGCPGKLHLIAQIKSSDAKTKEKRLHQKYSEFRINGEWFDFPMMKWPEVLEDFGQSPRLFMAALSEIEFHKGVAKGAMEAVDETAIRLHENNGKMRQFLDVLKRDKP